MQLGDEVTIAGVTGVVHQLCGHITILATADGLVALPVTAEPAKEANEAESKDQE